jgi:hypothetical protein
MREVGIWFYCPVCGCYIDTDECPICGWKEGDILMPNCP